MDITESIYAAFLRHPLVCTDTRNLLKGSLFFALKGDNFNGNAFAAQAIESGCAYAIVDDPNVAKGDKYFLVPDVLTALQEVARHHRRQLKIPFIGITGSNGKTTTKELIHAVLSKKYNTCSTKGNLNNHIGVPLTLLSVTREHTAAVIEMGANHVGEIAQLCAIAEPDYGIITNIGRAHLEGFGGAQGVIKAKSELYRHIKAHNGTLFVNADNELLTDLSSGITRVLYGTSAKADYKGKLIGSDPFVELECGSLNVRTNLAGKYNFENILAAACIGNYFQIAAQEVKAAIEEYVPSNNRSQVMKKGTNTILLDCYNANPTSMAAAIENFIEMKADNKVMILGDMLELGDSSREEHARILSLIGEKNFDGKVIVVGPLFSAQDTKPGVLKFAGAEQACDWLKANVQSGSTILVKGSRGIRLEKTVEFL